MRNVPSRVRSAGLSKASRISVNARGPSTTPRASSDASFSPVPSEAVSAIDAAAKVLTESSEPLNAKQMIEAMAAKGYWTSPGGKTPHATLYSAILREITAKGNDARFKKTERGHFTVNG